MGSKTLASKSSSSVPTDSQVTTMVTVDIATAKSKLRPYWKEKDWPTVPSISLLSTTSNSHSHSNDELDDASKSLSATSGTSISTTPTSSATATTSTMTTILHPTSPPDTPEEFRALFEQPSLPGLFPHLLDSWPAMQSGSERECKKKKIADYFRYYFHLKHTFDILKLFF